MLDHFSVYCGQIHRDMVYIIFLNLEQVNCSCFSKKKKFVNHDPPSMLLQAEKLTYEEFRAWLLENQDATSITRWLLCTAGTASNSLASPVDTPTFYQTLAGVTHCEY